jgi:GNAT superfamily N-acetyltransferase
MDISQTLSLYDEEQRRIIEYPGMRREATPHVVRHIDVRGTDSVVIFSSLDSENADEAITNEVSFFDKLGHNFEWKHFDHDSPPDLKARLEARGFEIEMTESIVALDLENTPKSLTQPTTHDVRRITDPEQIDEVMIVQDEVWGSNKDSLARRQLVYEMQSVPDTVSVYVAYANDQPVASAWIRFTTASAFASLWAGSTLTEYRRRGIYTALLSVRAQEAVERGKRFLTVDAGVMSLPILQRLGFQLLTVSTPCQWRRKK